MPCQPLIPGFAIPELAGIQTTALGSRLCVNDDSGF